MNEIDTLRSLEDYLALSVELCPLPNGGWEGHGCDATPWLVRGWLAQERSSYAPDVLRSLGAEGSCGCRTLARARAELRRRGEPTARERLGLEESAA